MVSGSGLNVTERLSRFFFFCSLSRVTAVTGAYRDCNAMVLIARDVSWYVKLHQGIITRSSLKKNIEIK